MKQKLTIIVHKFDRSLLIVKTQSDLSILLGVSISTIKRNYNDVGIYDTDIYTVYVGAQYYDNGIEKKYRHDAIPPIVKTYKDTEKTNTTQDIVQKIYPNHNIVQPIVDELDDDTLGMNQYQDFYSTKTLKELKEYRKKHIGRPYRLKWIEHYGKILHDKEGY